jgi:hypothetical protein
MNTGSSIFMFVGATALVLFLGIPLLLFPAVWGRRIGWKIPEQADLMNYFGRSLGGVALAIAIMCFQAARDPWGYRHIFDLIILIGIFMTAVHVYGFIRKTQPWFENVEVFLYPLVGLLGWIFYPRPG